MKINNQKGGLLVEALAILGIIALTSPMVYKKKIDKAQELEDIAKASQIKIVREATNNYIDSNYKTIADKQIISLNEMRDYLPPGFSSDGSISVGFRVQTTADADGNETERQVNAIIVDKEEYNEKRGNRVAGLIGADGGYSNSNNIATGSNSVWSVDTDKDFGIKTNSQVVATTSFSKNAATGEFLYKYKIEGQPKVNMMMTNIDMRGNDLNNTTHAGLKYGSDDNFNSWNLNGPENNKSQFGDGSMEGKNKDAKTTVSFQSNRMGATKNSESVNFGQSASDFNNGEEGNALGHGALTLLSSTTDKDGNELLGRGCAEILAKGDIGDGDGAGLFAACNNEAIRTAHLIAKSDNSSGEMRVRAGENKDIGASVFADRYKDGGNLDTDGATFEARDGKGNIAVQMMSEKQDVSHDKYFGSSEKDTGSASLELLHESEVKARSIATTSGGASYLKDGDNEETVKLIGNEALALATKEGIGHAGITGDYKKPYEGRERFITSSGVKPKEFTPQDGALFVRDNKDNHTTALVSSDNTGSGNLVLSKDDKQKVRATAKDGGSMYFSENNDNVTVSLEADRKLGSIKKEVENRAFAEVRKMNTSAEMYSELKGDLSTELSKQGDINDNKTKGGGAYLGFDNGDNTVKLMGGAGHDGSNFDGGALELTDADNTSKAIITTAMKSPTDDKNTGSSALIRTGSDDNYIFTGAKGKGASAEMVISSDKGKVSSFYDETDDSNNGGRMYFSNQDEKETVILSAKDNEENGGSVAVRAADEKGGLYVFGDKGGNGGAVDAMNTENKTSASLRTEGEGILELGDKEGRKQVEILGKDSGVVSMYRPYDDDSEDKMKGKRAIYLDASQGVFQAGQNSKLEAGSMNDAKYTAGMSVLTKNTEEAAEIKGVIFVRNNIDASKATVTAPIMKADKNLKFSDICIKGKDGKGSCLSDAAIEAGMSSTYKDLSKESANPYNKNGVKGTNFGRAVWQLISKRVMDLFDSNEHNDVQHLKKAWNGNCAAKMNPGSAEGIGEIEYIDENCNYKYINDEGDEVTSSASMSLKWYNIEKEKKEEEGKYEVINSGTEGAYSYKYNSNKNTMKQYAAVGHEHGATSDTLRFGYKPTYSGGKRDSTWRQNDPGMMGAGETYAAMGHAHGKYTDLEGYEIYQYYDNVKKCNKAGKEWVESYDLYECKWEKKNKGNTDFVQGDGVNEPSALLGWQKMIDKRWQWEKNNKLPGPNGGNCKFIETKTPTDCS